MRLIQPKPKLLVSPMLSRYRSLSATEHSQLPTFCSPPRAGFFWRKQTLHLPGRFTATSLKLPRHRSALQRFQSLPLRRRMRTLYREAAIRQTARLVTRTPRDAPHESLFLSNYRARAEAFYALSEWRAPRKGQLPHFSEHCASCTRTCPIQVNNFRLAPLLSKGCPDARDSGNGRRRILTISRRGGALTCVDTHYRLHSGCGWGAL